LAAQKPGARIQRADVEAAIAARDAAAAQAPETSPNAYVPPRGERLPVSPIRRVIAQRMFDGAQSTAPVTLSTEADATALVALREQIRAALEPRGLAVPGYTDLLIKLTAVALQQHPLLNAVWLGDAILVPDGIHIAVAVDAESGLVVPVIRDVPAKSLQQIAVELQALVERARTRKLTLEELEGGTFTITNLGAYGIDAFAPIINLPQCAILGVGRIVAKPAVVDDQIVPRRMAALSLTFDHRIVDGGPAARFLNTVREFVEQPALWLTR
jgi:pyruvate dehydrogenase E2 component (dihydrolipoamide acetyltransferase)